MLMSRPGLPGGFSVLVCSCFASCLQLGWLTWSLATSLKWKWGRRFQVSETYSCKRLQAKINVLVLSCLVVCPLLY